MSHFTDISGKDIQEVYEEAPTKKWIKQIPYDKTIRFEDYHRKEHFIPVAEIVLDTEMATKGKKAGKKQRDTLIQFVPTVKKVFNKEMEWLYLLLINGRIVKLGGTRNGLQKRAGSYLCGHHVEERGKSGDCSKTNGFIYNTLVFYLELGCKVEMMGYPLPKTETTIQIFGQDTVVVAQTYHAYESKFLDDYKKKYREYPCLSDNCDPVYKS
jgi:hypothetical protein